MKYLLYAHKTWLLTILLAMTAMTALSSEYVYTSTCRLKVTGEELVRNGDFSAPVSYQGWSGSDGAAVNPGAWAFVQYAGPDGKNVMQSGGQEGALAQAVAVQPGLYLVRFQLLGSTDSKAAQVAFFNENGNLSYTEGDRVVLDASNFDATAWTTVEDTLTVDANGFVVFNLSEFAEGFQVTNFSVRQADLVFDIRALSRFSIYVETIVNSGYFTNDAGGFVNNMNKLNSFLWGNISEQEYGIDFDDMAAGQAELERLKNALNTYMEENSADLLADEKAFNTYGDNRKWNSQGSWTGGESGRWFSGGNGASKNIPEVVLNYPYNGTLPDDQLYYPLIVPQTGTYLFKIESMGHYYRDSNVPDINTPFRGVRFFAGKNRPVRSDDFAAITGNQIQYNYNNNQVNLQPYTFFFYADEGDTIYCGAQYINDQSTSKRGGLLHLAYPVLRLVGMTQAEFDYKKLVHDIKTQRDLLAERIQSANELVARQKADGFPWGHAVLQQAINDATSVYTESFNVIDAGGNVVDASRITKEYRNGEVANASNLLLTNCRSFESLNAHYSKLLTAIAEANASNEDPLNAEGDHATFLIAINDAQTVANGVTSDETLEGFTPYDCDAAVSRLKDAQAAFEAATANFHHPSELAIVDGDWSESNNAIPTGWGFSEAVSGKERFGRTADANFEGGYRRGVWRGYTAAPTSKLVQTVKLLPAGVYEYRAQAYAANEGSKGTGGAQDQAMWKLVYETVGEGDEAYQQVVDTLFNGNSEVKLFFGPNSSPDSTRVKSPYFGFPIAENREANLYQPQWYSVYYVKTHADEEIAEFGMDSFGQAQNGSNGANAYGFGSNHVYYLGSYDQCLADLKQQLDANIQEARTILRDYCKDYRRSMATLRLAKALHYAEEAIATDNLTAIANTRWALLQATQDARPFVEPIRMEGERSWDFTQWSQQTRDELLAEASTVAAPLEHSKATHHSWRAFEKYNATDNMENANHAYWWGDNSVGNDGQLEVFGHVIPETQGLLFNVKAGNLSIAVDYIDAGTKKETGGQYLWMGGKNNTITIPNVKPNWYISVDVASHKAGDLRGLDACIEGLDNMYINFLQGQNRVDSFTTCVWQVPASVAEEGVNVKLINNNGCNIYYLKVSQDYIPPVEGADMTALITNASYNQGTEGWNTEGGQDWTVGTANMKVDWEVCEAWNVNHFDIHQQLRQMPEGIYELDVQGFYRYMRDHSAYDYYTFGNDIELPVRCYMNGMGKPLKNVFAEPADSGNVYDPENMMTYISPDGQYWFPNSMKSASVAFANGMYHNHAYGYVSPIDGVLRLGMKGSTHQANDSWAIWDNFQLTYRGRQPDASKNAALQLIDEMRTELDGHYNSSLKQYMDNHVAVAQQLEPTYENREQLYQNFIELLAKRDELTASYNLYAQLKTAIDSLKTAIDQCKRIRPKGEAELYYDQVTRLYDEAYDDQLAAQAIEYIQQLIEKLKNAEYEPYVTYPRRWDFSNWSQTTKELLHDDALTVNAPLDNDSRYHYSWRAFEKTNETDNLKNLDKVYWWGWQTPVGRQLVNRNGQVFYETEGIYINAAAAGSIAIAVDYPSTDLGNYAGGQYLWLGGKKRSFFIPDVCPGSTITMGVESHNQSEGRGLDMSINGVTYDPIEGTTRPMALTKCVWQVPNNTDAAVDVMFESSNGCHIYYIEVKLPDSMFAEGQDLTSLVFNPSFAQNTYGWSTEGGHDWTNGNPNMRVDHEVCEAWNVNYFDVHQQLGRMPEGIYELDVQGFYRYLRDNDAYNYYTSGNDIKVPVQIYMNGMGKSLKNIFEEPVAYGDLYHQVMSVYPSPDGNYWFPNSMWSASAAFDNDMYHNLSYGHVDAQDGLLRLGVKGSTNQAEDSWAIWDNFRLTYRGKQPDASKNAVLQLAERVELVKEQHYACDLRVTLNNLIATTQQMEATENNREPLYQNFTSLLQAESRLEPSIMLFDTLRLAIDSLEQAIQTYTQSQTTTAQAQIVLGQVRTGYEGNYTDEDARQALALIAQTINALRMNEPDETCQSVSVAQSGNTLTLTSESGAVIYYTTDDSAPTTLSTRYEQPIDIDHFCTVKSIAVKQGKKQSTVAAYEVKYLFGENSLTVKSAGLLSAALAWPGAVEMRQLRIIGNLSSADFSPLRSLTDLQQLDLSEAILDEGKLPEEAFAGMRGLVAFASPREIGNVGEHLFRACSSLAAIQWKASRALPTTAMQDVSNPNLLVYVNSKGFAPSNFRNIVANGTAEEIVLSDVYLGSNANFFCPETFHATKISYVHSYEMTTERLVAKGWETLALPFNVQTVTHKDKGTIAPFADGSASEETCRFWLYALNEGSGFQRAAQIEAFKPYIISMPNSQEYAQRYNLGGVVTFSAANVDVAATPVSDMTVQGNKLTLTPVFCGLEQEDRLFALNVKNSNTPYYGVLQEGSTFIAGLRSIRPFEAYATLLDNSARETISLGELFDEGTTDIDSIQTVRPASGAIYDLGGRKMSSEDGQHQPLKKGIYVQQGRKIVISKNQK